MFTNLRKRRKRIALYLYNDELNSFEVVVQILAKYLPKCNRLRAEQLAIIAHNVGKVKLCTGFSPDIYKILADLIKAGLLVEAQENSK